jgi:hypothetical protein
MSSRLKTWAFAIFLVLGLLTTVTTLLASEPLQSDISEVPPQKIWTQCKSDKECTVVVRTCKHCCSREDYAGISKSFEAEYKQLHDKKCQAALGNEEPTACYCSEGLHGEVHCIQNHCDFVKEK